jgi:O-acetyl-ADP-ribose deacetylase (regulator of RNase III)
VDAIVNAANSALAGGGGVDGAIHARGGPSLMQELRQYEGCPAGSAVVTGAGRLPAKYVFHAVGPVYRGGDRGEAKLLASCYASALKLAKEHGCESISFPSISTGIYGYPLDDAAQVALSAITETLPTLDSELRVVKLVQFSELNYSAYQKLFSNFPAQQTSAQTS